MQHDHSLFHGAVLRIVNDPANGAENIGKSDTTRQEPGGKSQWSKLSHMVYLYIRVSASGLREIPPVLALAARCKGFSSA